MKKVALVAAVALLGLALGAAVAGRPQVVSNDVVSSDIVVPRTSVASTAPTTTDRPSTTPPSSTAVPSTAASVPTTVARVTATAPSTTTTLLAEGAIRVVVANATNAPGLATRTADAIVTLGYTDVVRTDAVTDRADTVVFYGPGLGAEGLRLSSQFGLDPVQVQPRPAGALTESDSGGELWVLLGTDQL